MLIFNIETLFNILNTGEPSISFLVMCQLTVLLEQGLAGNTMKNQVFLIEVNEVSTQKPKWITPPKSLNASISKISHANRDICLVL